MALDAPTNFKVRQRYTRTDDFFIERAIVGAIESRRNPPYHTGVPEFEERWIELQWDEVESDPCDYEIWIDQGGDNEAVLARIESGVGRATIRTARREKDGFALPDWGKPYNEKISIRAVSDIDSSPFVSITLTDDPSFYEASLLEISEFSTSGDGGKLVWTPDATGSLGTLVYIYKLPVTSWPVAVFFARAPLTEITWPHILRRRVNDDVFLLPGSWLQGYPAQQLWFANDEDYQARVVPIISRQQTQTVKKTIYGRTEWLSAPYAAETIKWADAPTAFKLEPMTISPIVGVPFEVQIPASVTVESWEITSGAEEWIDLDATTGVLRVIAPSAATRTITVEATASGPEVRTAKITITPQPRPAPPVVKMSSTVLANGFVYRQGESIVIQPTAAGAQEWDADLPDGLSIDPTTGRIYGAILDVGRYNISVRARSEYSEWSAALELPIKIEAQPTGVDLAGLRFPWLEEQWHLTDLQVDLVSRAVSTSRLVDRTLTSKHGDQAATTISVAKKTLVLKVRDTINFAVMFLRGHRAPALSGVESIRIAIRPLDNVNEPFFFQTDSSPAGTEEQGATYYLISGTLGDVAEDALLEALDATGENTPIPAIGEVEWQLGGKVYTSQTFEVLLELDIARDE